MLEGDAKVTIEIDPQTLDWAKFTLGKMSSTVKLMVFTNIPCVLCGATVELANKIAELTPKIQVEVYDARMNAEVIAKYAIDKFPAIMLLGKEENNARFFGIPAGFEFGVLIEDLVTASVGPTDLSEDVKIKLRQLAKPVHIQVFTLPTCPKCPLVARLVHKFAFYNKNITADVIDSMEFRELASANRVYEVPKTVVNGTVEIRDVLQERDLADRLLAI
jgi:glutaredoxin-like protein